MDATPTAKTTLIEIDHRSANALAPAAELPVIGTLAFIPSGNLLVLERRFEQGSVVVHEYAVSGGGWVEVRAVTLKGFKGSPVGCAVSPDGTRLAVGLKTAKVFEWPSGKAVASMPAVKYELERNSLGFSPTGARLTVTDGGYVSPRQRTAHVCDASTGNKIVSIKTNEWSFAQAGMIDESTVVTLGLALDWEFGEESTEEQRVLGCYDAGTGKPRWRRVLRAGQLAGLDKGARLVWVAADTGPYATGNLVGLAADDGLVAREVGFSGDFCADVTPPAAVGRGLIAVSIASRELRVNGYFVLDVEGARQIAALGHDGELDVGNYPPTAHADTRRVAAVGDGKTFVWQLP